MKAKKLLSFLLAAVLVLAFFPMSGFAAVNSASVTSTSVTYAATNRDVEVTLQGSSLADTDKVALDSSGLNAVTVDAADDGNSGAATLTIPAGKTDGNDVEYTINYSTDGSNWTPTSAKVTALAASTDASITGITVSGKTATLDSGTNYNVELPFGTVLSSLQASDIVVAVNDTGKATAAAATTSDSGATWSVVVTAEDDSTEVTYTIDVTVAAATAISWTGLTANGTTNSVTTTELTLTFDVEPTGLQATDITVTGATRGALTGSGTTRTLAINTITVANGETVKVDIANPAGFTITPASKTVAVNVAPVPRTITAPSPVTANNVTATVTFSPTGQQVAGTAITATVTLTNNTTDKGTFVIDLTSAKAGLVSSPKTLAVAATSAPGTTVYTFPFTVPNEDVDDLELTFTFTDSTKPLLTLTMPTFSIVEGAADPAPKPIVVKEINGQNANITDITINDTELTLTGGKTGTVVAGGTDDTNWTIQPINVSSLAAGVYTRDVTFIYDSSAEAKGTVTLNVNAGSVTPPPSTTFVPVTDITGVAGVQAVGSFNMTGSVTPANATNKTIQWDILSAGATGATMNSATVVKTTAPGTLVMRATVANGATATTAFTKDFTIEIYNGGTTPPTDVTPPSSGGSSNDDDDDDDNDDFYNADNMQGGGGGGSTYTPPVSGATSSTVSSNVAADGTVSHNAVATDAREAIADSVGTTANIVVRNAKEVTPETLENLANIATNNGKTLTLMADTTNGNAVEGRLYVEPAKLANLNTELLLGVSTTNAAAETAETIFEQWFANDVAVVSCAQQGTFGAELQIAAKVDLAGLDTTTLIFYSYNKATNSYARIAAPRYYVDANGYLHFFTTLAGDIIITDAPLSK